MTAKTVSLDDLNIRKAHANAFPMEYLDGGKPSGLFFDILGAQSEQVQDGIAALLDERREREAAATAALKAGETPPYTSVKEDKAFGERSAFLRVVGWRRDGETDGLSAEQKKRFRGLTEAYTPELALKLCQNNPDFGLQVVATSDKGANFTKPSSPK
jgi:hypothetical protein